MGAGEAVSSGRNLQGWLARYPIIALRMAGEALAEGRPVPEQAVTLISNSPLPLILWRWLFTTIGTRTSPASAGERHQPTTTFKSPVRSISTMTETDFSCLVPDSGT